MTKTVTHNLVRFTGEKDGKAQWKECARLVHDDVTGKDVLWVNPAAMRNVLRGFDTDEGVPFLLCAKTGQSVHRQPVVPPQNKADNPPFDTAAPGGYVAQPAQYTEPPIDFDDDIPF